MLLPLAATVLYLYVRAEDEYHSDVSFSIRSEEPGAAAAGILGAITGFSGGGSAAEPDILFEYIRSQEIVAAIDKKIDLRTIYNRKPDDWAFSLGEGATIENLLTHWRRMVDVSYENHSGIIQVRATAFTPEDARAITRAVLEKSTELVNRLAEQARADGSATPRSTSARPRHICAACAKSSRASAASTRWSIPRPTWRGRWAS